MKIKILFFVFFATFIFACETALGPNEIGGDTNIDLTKVGNDFGISPSFKGTFSPALNNIRDTIIITKNEGGIITIKGRIFSDLDAASAIDTLLGTSGLPETTKHQIVDAYLSKYDITIDTSDEKNMNLTFETKLKVTSEGIQDFHYSKGDLSKPFTIVKYGSNVGDKYEFTTKEGKKIVREVVQKNPVEDWDLSFWKVKTIRVEQMIDDDPILEKVTFITNHKYGLVGLIHKFKDGKIIETTILPWAVL
jgi:hypothetical protein